MKSPDIHITGTAALAGALYTLVYMASICTLLYLGHEYFAIWFCIFFCGKEMLS